ncbi:hypothetical protein L195_g006957 [Trifolium pratense]|uniref:Transmembrane protein n=1 Tax=Trifolium pratense TaxID=57577 RepID=A0A2K3P520_TRIPR|nr:hypothetical protein L195_g006957 [Trifolium pratense]
MRLLLLDSLFHLCLCLSLSPPPVPHRRKSSLCLAAFSPSIVTAAFSPSFRFFSLVYLIHIFIFFTRKGRTPDISSALHKTQATPKWVVKKIALGTWVFSVAGALLAIPVGIKRKSLAPLVFFGTTGTMLDIIMGITACEREHAERQMKLLEEAQSAAAAETSLHETHSDS